MLPNDGEAVGEVEVRGPWVTGSYYKDDDPEKFRDGWLRTGDVGTIDPARLRHADRPGQGRDQVRRRVDLVDGAGERADGPPARSTEAAVIGVPDDKWGERPLATVVLAAGGTVTAAELRAFLAERVPRWQLPERWSFIAEVPKTSVGKFAKTSDARGLRPRRLRGDRGALSPAGLVGDLLCRRSPRYRYPRRDPHGSSGGFA